MTVQAGPGRSPAHSAAGHRLGATAPRREGPADLRLVLPALATWATAALALGVPGHVAAAGAAACCLAAGAALWAARRARRAPRARAGSRGVALAAATTLLCAAAGAAAAGLHAADVRRGPVPELAAEYGRGTAQLSVTGDPRTTAAGVRGARRTAGLVVVPAEVHRVTTGDGETAGLRAPVLLLVRPADAAARSAWRELLPSTTLRTEARFAPADRDGARDLAAVLRVAEHGPPTVTGPPSAVQRAAGDLRQGLREAGAGLAPDPRALLPGLVVGDTTLVPEDLDAAFRATDMLHLLAVSGGNLTVLLMLLIGPPGTASRAERRGLAPRLGISLRGTAVLAALVTLGFVLVCRPEPSVLRAAACGLITILAIGTGRRRSLIPALAAAVVLLVLHDPWLARDFGFLLSVLATGSLLTVAPRWSAALRGRGVPGRLAEALAAAAAAQAACAPVVAVLAAHVSLVSVPCNLLAEFVVAPATVLGFAALAAAPVSPQLAEVCAWLAGWPTGAIAVIARTGAAVPGATVAWPGTWPGALLLAVVTAAVLALVRRLPGRPWLCGLCAALLLVALVRPPSLTRTLTGWPPPGWRLVVCDVGQGDALVLNLGEGSAVLVDTGPDPGAVDRCLRALGVTVLPLVVLTHFHADHVAGLPGALRGRTVGAIQTTGLEEPRDQAEFVHRTARHAGVTEVRAVPGERRTAGRVSWRVLWPQKRRPPSTAGPSAGGTGGVTDTAGEDGANNASVTLLVRTGELTLFLPGDLEPPAQRRLLAAHPGLPQVDVLKVAHHGSAYQDQELLDRLSPRIALISCGADNPYGHPSPHTLHALRADGALVRRTDRGGALAVTAPGAVVARSR